MGRGGRLVAVRAPDGRLAAVGDKAGQFELGRWLEHDGDGRTAEKAFEGGTFRCDWTGCVGEVRGQRIAVNRHAAGLADDCRSAVLIVAGRRAVDCPALLGLADAPTQVGADAARQQTVRDGASEPHSPVSREREEPRHMGPARLILQEPALSKAGAYAIRLRPDGRIDVQSVAQARGHRLWTSDPERSARRAASRVGELRAPTLPRAGESEMPNRLLDDHQ